MDGSTVAEARAKYDTSLSRLRPVDLKHAKAGSHHDGGGLYLQVREGRNGLTRSWVLRYMRDSKARIMGLGPFDVLSLAEAREKAREARRLLLDGIDPIDAREAVKAQRRVASASTMTFRQAAEAYIAAQEIGWKNAKHARQWPTTLKAYAYPVLGDLPVAAIDTGLVMKVLGPIWTAKPETASRVRGRIEKVLDWAAASGYRQGENPARWRGHLQNLLSAPAKTKRAVRQAQERGEHHGALPYAKVAGFMATLRAQPGTAARALEFTILTAARTGEVIGARWSEIDLEGRVWVVPGDRMKAGKEHRVPLSDRAVAILGNGGARGDYVFEGGKPGQPLSNMAMLAALKRMGLRGRGTQNVTVHGFRSTFIDWATECTEFQREMRELALAHTLDDKVEAAYRRGDMFEKRREMMAEWAQFCEPKSVK
jgi:integrase